MKQPREHRHSVIVIGAGMSGLACARELLHRGFWVMVVEARPRVGGRLKGSALQISKEETHDVDLGGALIHGTEENPISELTEQLGVSTKPVSETLLMDKEGWPVDLREDDKLSTVFNECLEEAFRRTEGKQSQTSFGSLFEKVCSEKGVNFSALLRWHKSNLEVSCGASFERLGWQWNEDEPYGFDGDHAALEKSWKEVVEKLAEPLDILYESPVEHIHIVHPKTEVSSGNIDVVEDKSPKKVLQTPVKHKDGKGKKALLDSRTTQPRQSKRLRGVGAENRRSTRAINPTKHFTVNHAKSDKAKALDRPSRVDPAEVGPKQTLVQLTLQNGNVLEADSVVCTVPLGVLKKNVIQFEPPLPAAKKRAIHRLGTGLLNKCALSFPQVFWQDSDFLALAGEQYSYLVLNGATYTGKPILVFMYGGDFAQEIESWTDAEIVKDCLKVLKSICGCKVPPPLDYSVTRWGHDPYSGMSFSYVPPGVDGIEELKNMGQPILDSTGTIPTLSFAGEHTTPYHPSTIHGAFITGIREAYRLDLAVDPGGNGNLPFQEEELYMRTFPVNGEVASLEPESIVSDYPKRNELTIQRLSSGGHRSRGASGVMRLRSSSSVVSPNYQISSPSRRSQRSITARQSKTEASDEDSTDADEQLEGMLDRSLLRGVESYGRDYQFLRDNVLPVYGSSIRATAGEVKERCRSLVNEKRLNQEYPASVSSWRSWGARVVYPSKYALRERRSAKPSSSTPKRRKLQTVSPPPPMSKTKSGRHIIQPAFLAMDD